MKNEEIIEYAKNLMLDSLLPVSVPLNKRIETVCRKYNMSYSWSYGTWFFHKRGNRYTSYDFERMLRNYKSLKNNKVVMELLELSNLLDTNVLGVELYSITKEVTE